MPFWLVWVLFGAIVGLSRLITWYSSLESQAVGQNEAAKLASLVLAGILFFLSLPIGLMLLTHSMLPGLSVLLGGPAISLWLGIAALQPARSTWSAYQTRRLDVFPEDESVTSGEPAGTADTPVVMPASSAMPTSGDRFNR